LACKLPQITGGVKRSNNYGVIHGVKRYNNYGVMHNELQAQYSDFWLWL